jgi:co-chaperonin GroES (HSP10)
MNIEMLNGNILGELQSQEKESGLYVPDNKAYKVIKVVNSKEKDVEKDSLIYVLKNAGTELEIEGVKYISVNVREIILII